MINGLLAALVVLGLFTTGLCLGLSACGRFVNDLLLQQATAGPEGWVLADNVERYLSWWGRIVGGYLVSVGRVETRVWLSHGTTSDHVIYYRLVLRDRPMPPPEGGPGERNEEAGS